MMRLYLSFQDPVDEDYTVFCVYKEKRARKEDRRPNPDGREMVFLSPYRMSLRAVFCIERTKADGMMNPYCDRPWGEKRWEVEFPLPLLEELEFEFVVTEFESEECEDCQLLVNHKNLVDYVREITVLPKAGSWPFDDEEELVKTRRYVEERGFVRKHSLCGCDGQDLSKEWLDFLWEWVDRYKFVKDDSSP
jgi:hypothetical protein